MVVKNTAAMDSQRSSASAGIKKVSRTPPFSLLFEQLHGDELRLEAQLENVRMLEWEGEGEGFKLF